MFEEIPKVKDYLNLLPDTALFDALEPDEQDRAIFGAAELLKSHYRRRVTTRSIALQVLHKLESDSEYMGVLKRQGVQSYSTKGISVSFRGDVTTISDDVVSDLGYPSNGAKVGRMI